METVEMDLMQAQIAELTTEVTRLQRSAGGSNPVVFNAVVESEELTTITCDLPLDKVISKTRSGVPVVLIYEDEGVSTYYSTNIAMSDMFEGAKSFTAYFFVDISTGDYMRGYQISYSQSSADAPAEIAIIPWYGVISEHQ